MLNYSLNKEDEKKFVKCIKESGNGLDIVFADGSVFKGVKVCDENIEKVNAVQEEQAKKGLSNYKVFKNRERGSKLGMISGGGAGLGASIVAAANFASSVSPVLIPVGIGVVTVLGAIPAFCKFVKNRRILGELDKISYRNEHMSDLANYRDYPNSLAGMSNNKRKYFEKSEKPFSLVNVDKYDIEDLSRIVGNIEKEESFGFSYCKK